MIEHASAGTNLLQGGIQAKGWPIRAMGTHGLDHIGHGENLGLKQDLLVGQPARITRSIQMFMVLIDNIRHRPGKGDVLEDIVADLGMALDDRPLLGGEPGRFGEILRGQGDLADIMEQGGKVQAFDLFFRQAQFAGDGAGQGIDPHLMPPRCRDRVFPRPGPVI